MIGLLLLFGFGAKLGVLPFYEWFPAAYGSGSGATGVIFSGVVLNAAFYSLARGVLQWLPRAGVWTMSVAIIMIIAGVLSAILSIFNAFQEEDWRRMLSLSSAENAGVAVAVLGVFLIVCCQRIAGSRGVGVDRMFTAPGGPQSGEGHAFSHCRWRVLSQRQLSHPPNRAAAQ